MKFILFLVVFPCVSYFVFKLDNQSDPNDFWAKVLNFILAIMLTIIVWVCIVSAPIILLGIVAMAIICLFAIFLAWIHSFFIK